MASADDFDLVVGGEDNRIYLQVNKGSKTEIHVNHVDVTEMCLRAVCEHFRQNIMSHSSEGVSMQLPDAQGQMWLMNFKKVSVNGY